MKPKVALNRRDNRPKKPAEPIGQAVKTLNRAEVASKLGKTISGVRHLEGIELRPKKVDGVWLLDAHEVEALAKRLGVRKAGELSPGELAARACELFREGRDAVDAVIALRQPFEVILPLQRTFVEESGIVVLPRAFAEQLAQICNVPRITPECLVQALDKRDRTIDELTARLHDARPNLPSS